MKPLVDDPETLARRLQRFLPLPAHGRPQLVGMLKKRSSKFTASARLIVTNVYYIGGKAGLMCQIDLASGEPCSSVLVVPITVLAFDRRHPISRDVAEYRRRRTDNH